MMLQGQTAIVTGAAEGVGRHVALRLAREGARLVLADVQSAEATAELAQKAGGIAAYVPCDIADERSVRSCVDTAVTLLDGRVDILVNNAGINGQAQLVQDMTLPSWERTLRVNLTGTMLVTREVTPVMIREGGGQIVNIASNVAKRGLPYRADYVASKWALLGLTQTLALELVSHQIRVNAVCPGPVEGQRIEQVMRSHAEAEGRTLAEIRKAWENDAPMKRFVSPDEVAAVVCFLASGESSAMTGQALNVTGGFLMN